MPFKSQAQRRFMFSQHPQVANKWQNEFQQKKLPDVAPPVEQQELPPDHMVKPNFKQRILRGNFGALTSYLDKK